MEISHKDDGKKGVFYIEKDKNIIAEMTYVWSGTDKVIIDHTEVAEELEGRGIGKQLVQKSVEMAREKNIKIIPLCPFAKGVFARVAAYNDVLYK